MQPQATQEEQRGDTRREYRQIVFKRASIIKGTSTSEVRCTIRNQNSGGAALQVSPEARVPEEFLLYVPVDGVAYSAVLKWRSGERAGVAFVGSGPKPPLHYG